MCVIQWGEIIAQIWSESLFTFRLIISYDRVKKVARLRKCTKLSEPHTCLNRQCSLMQYEPKSLVLNNSFLVELNLNYYYHWKREKLALF